MSRKETKKLALASLLCALSVVVSVIGCVFDVADLTACTVASALVAMADTELRGKYPFLVYATTSVLLFLLFPTSSLTLYFILFFGFYPIIKKYIEKLPKLPAYLVKLVVFNVAIFLIYFLMTKILLSAEAENKTYLLVLLWVFSNVFFAVYDFALSVLMVAYIRHYRKKWGIDKFLLH